MDTNEIAKRLKDMIIKDRIQEVIALLRENLTAFNDQISEAELLQFSARINSIDRENSLGIIPPERFRIERNQIRQILIEKITQLEKAHQPAETNIPTFQLEDGDVLVDEASQLFRDGEYQQAVEVLSGALNKSFKRYSKAEAYAILGNIYNKMDYFQDAIAAHQKSLELEPNSAKYWTNLGIVYRLTAQYDKAENCYEKALAIDPDYPELYTSLGALHLTHTMKFQKAIYYLEKAIQLDPGQTIAYANMAIAQASVGKFAEAEAFLKKATMKGYKNTKKLKSMIENLKQL
jgi:Flp pilus assembly protein TadD